MKSSSRATIAVLLRGHRVRVVMMAVASMLAGLAEAVFLVVITRAAFAITEGKSTIGVLAGRRLSVHLTVVFALALVAVRVGMVVASNWYSAVLNAEVTRDLRARLARAFLRSTWAVQQASRAGRLQELVISSSNAGSSLVSSFCAGVIAAFSVGAMLTLAVGVNPAGSLVAIVAVAALGLILRPLRRRVYLHARRAADDAMKLATATNEVSGLGLAVHVFDVRAQVEDRVSGLLDSGVHSVRRLNVVRGMVPAIYVGLAYLALIGAIALASVWDTASLTSLGAVMLVMLRSLGYGQQLQTAYSGIQSTLPQVNDVFSEIKHYEENEFVDAGDPVDAVCPIVFDDVSFHYIEGQPVLRNVSATIQRNELIGIVGPSGSGKSTLVQLLLGLREPVAGRVLAAGKEIPSLQHSQWARKVTFVPQEPVLIEGTIAENIRFYRQDVSDAAIEEAAGRAGLHEVVLGFPLGYQHPVVSGGGNLSGGQQQRLCIARALVAQPELLILDEPTGALDVVSESLIRETLHDLRSRMSIVVIAHRLSTIDQCDRIMIIQHGTIAAFDSPQQLRASSNFYSDATGLSGLD